MTKIAITGAKGVVGSVLTEQLGSTYDIIPIDLPEIDMLEPRDHTKLVRAIGGAQVAIHLAGIFGPASEGKENWLSPHQDPRNKWLLRATLSAARYSGFSETQQIIHASSIHVEDTRSFLQRSPNSLLMARSQEFDTEASSGYGKSKREQEILVRQHAGSYENGAASIRLGGVMPDNLPMREHPRRPEIVSHEQKVWLEHGDLGRLVGLIIENPPRYCEVLYAVSDNDGRFHDTTNNFGWEPQANSADYLTRIIIDSQPRILRSNYE